MNKMKLMIVALGSMALCAATVADDLIVTPQSRAKDVINMFKETSVKSK